MCDWFGAGGTEGEARASAETLIGLRPEALPIERSSISGEEGCRGEPLRCSRAAPRGGVPILAISRGAVKHRRGHRTIRDGPSMVARVDPEGSPSGADQ